MKLRLRRSLLLLISVFLFTNTASLFSVSNLTPGGLQSGSARTSVSPGYDRGLIALNQTLKDLANPFTVMAVAASAADIDYGTLAYYRKRLGARTVITLATRDESGERGVPSGFREEGEVINTRRAIAAASIVDSDLYFLNLRDSGYTKFAEEALSKWGNDVALARLVRAIRLLRPDVIIGPPDSKKNDGQQQAVERLLAEALDTAADVSRFSEPDTEPWRVSRIFQRVEEEAQEVAVNLDEFDVDRGMTYAQIGKAALKQYKSAAGWPERIEPEASRAYYKLKRSAPDDRFRRGGSLFDGITLPENLARSIAPPRVGDYSLAEAIGMRDKLIEALRERLVEKRAEGTVADIRGRYGSQFFRMIRYTETLERAIAQALGLALEATLSDRVLVRGQKVSLRLRLLNGSSRPLPIVFHTPETITPPDKNPSYKPTELAIVNAGGVATEEFLYQVQDDAALTLPLSSQIYKENYYAISTLSAGARDLTVAGASLVAFAEVEIEQTTVPLPARVNFDVAPPIEISTIPFALVKDWSKPRDFEFTVNLRNRAAGPFRGEFWIVPLGLTVDDYKPQIISFMREDEEVGIKVKLRLPVLKPPLSPEILFEVRREKPAPPAAIASVTIPVKTADFEVADGVKVGYVSGFDGWLGFALNQLGVEHYELKVTDLKAPAHGAVESDSLTAHTDCGDLSRFDAIIIDNLAYYTRPDLIIAQSCLHDYVSRGGTLVVLYQQPDDLNLLLGRGSGSFAPFPIKLSKDRITIETAPVKILEPEHPILTKPNQITEKDFEGWVGDRAVYVPSEWAAEYAALLESNDPGEEARKGGFLVARPGEGRFIYTTFDWRKQALAANPGAYRVLANIVSLTKTSKAEPSTKPAN